MFFDIILLRAIETSKNISCNVVLCGSPGSWGVLPLTVLINSYYALLCYAFRLIRICMKAFLNIDWPKCVDIKKCIQWRFSLLKYRQDLTNGWHSETRFLSPGYAERPFGPGPSAGLISRLGVRGRPPRGPGPWNMDVSTVLSSTILRC